MRVRRLCLSAFVVVVLAASCSIPGTHVVDGEGIAGTYTLNGVDTSDVEYSGTVVIVATDDPEVYGVEWIITGAIQQGVGRLRGDRFDVEWESVIAPRGANSGTASYVLDDEGNFTGTREVDGVDGVATEDIFQEA